MPITTQDVLHIAKLARIKLTPEEVEKFTSELSTILQFIEKLKELDTTEVPPVRGGSLLINQKREDIQMDSNLEQKQEVLLQMVPHKEKEWVKVKAIFE
ncbi:MAG: Asp-tRNA(Asn)/Glu-tRNA(Gln) amidotransferase subunit GatC [Candidatus Colwellbacteria bacterium]|nr:Asp-tRNA(Asn)/Glu-tRNA(Gln) amidotransferase subunit GatC [Candidatus Colwellbacteria bacterium]